MQLYFDDDSDQNPPLLISLQWCQIQLRLRSTIRLQIGPTMLKFINISLLLLLFSNMAMAQSSLVFYDANQSRMGTLVRPIGAGSNNLELMTHDGYLITIGTEIGVITEPTNDPKPEVLHFSNEDCTGISYFSANSDWMKHRGGQIIRVGPLPGELFSVEWGSFASIEMRSSLSFFAVGCSIEEQGYIVSEAVKATAVSPGEYLARRGNNSC